MFSKKHIYNSVFALFACMLVLAGCKTTPSAPKLEKGKELGKWMGEWQSFSEVSALAEMDAKYKELAANMPHYTAEGLKASIVAGYASPIVKAKFDGSNTVVFTVRDADGQEKEIACTYRYKGDVPVIGYDGYFWHTFEAVEPVKGLAKAQYLIAFPPHQHGEGLKHWHARFGSAGIDALVKADPMWWPTYVDAAMTEDEVKKAFAETLGAMIGTLPAEPFDSYKGKWMNSSMIYEDARPAIQKAYTDLIKEFAGKNPSGGDFSKEDIIALAKKAYGGTEDFTHLEFITDDDKNELIVWKDMTKVVSLAYVRDAANESKPNLKAFTAVDKKKAGKFAHISMTNAHGTPLHMHLWYGATPADIEKVVGTPTCVPADASEADIALRVLKTGRRFLKGVAK